jgi:16S rRNA (guanine(1405)-N(7))-methyltransferase
MPDSSPLLEELVQSVHAASRYQAISLDLVRQVGARELAKGRKLKEAIKTTRAKLHQVAVAYQESAIPYNRHIEELKSLPSNLSDPGLQAFCRKVMAQHASTAERLPILDTFFHSVLGPLAPIHSILDLACGLTPLARPWMPLENNVRYDACDIYSDMVDFTNLFFHHLAQPGQAELCDLTQACPTRSADVALLLKSVPCLEQLDKQLIPRLLQQIPADHIVVSFPDRSLGGRQKGMAQFYSTHFESLVQNMPFDLRSLKFPGEIVYVLSKHAPPPI